MPVFLFICSAMCFILALLHTFCDCSMDSRSEENSPGGKGSGNLGFVLREAGFCRIVKTNTTHATLNFAVPP